MPDLCDELRLSLGMSDEAVASAVAALQHIRELRNEIILPAGHEMVISLTRQGVLKALAELLGTDEATARDWLIAKASAFRGESEATTAQRFEEL